MTLPPQLLNRVNKDLKQKVDQLGADLQRQRALATLEAEVYAVTAGKVKDSKSQHAALEQLASQNRKKLEILESETQQMSALLARLRQDTESHKGFSRDLLTKLAAVEAKVSSTRVRLEESEKKSAENQQAALAWIDENKMALGAASQAGSVLAGREALLKKLKADAEAIQVQIKLVNDLLEEETATTVEIQREVSEAKTQTDAAQQEKHRILTQMLELTQREEGLDLRHESITQRQRELTAQLEEKKLLIKHLQSELAAEVDAGKKTEQAIQAFAATRARVEAMNKKLTSEMSEGDLQAALMEQQIQIGSQNAASKRRQLQGLTQSLQTAQTKLDKREMKVEILGAELQKMQKENASTQQETVAADNVLEEYQRELASLQHAMDEGRYLLQAEIAKQRANAESTDDVSVELMRLQQHLRTSEEKAKELQEKFSDLGGVADALEVAVEHRRAEVAELAAKHSEGNLEVREQRRQQIKELEKELEFMERETLRTRRAVEAAKAAAYAHRRRLAEEDEYEAELARNIDEMQLEIKALSKDVEALFEKKVKAAEVADSTLWRLEGLRSQAANQHDGLVNQLTATGELEAAARQEEMDLQAERDGLLVELHAHEDERRKMAQRLAAASGRVVTLKSRYEDLMAALHRQVKEDVPTAPKAEAEEVEWLSPAELQAKHLIQKAVERDALQQQGDGLDRALVKAEQDLRLLDVAYSQLKQQMDAARLMIAEGRVEALADGYSASEEEEQQMFLRGLRAQFEEEASLQTEVLSRELLLLGVEVEEKAKRLQDLRAAQNEKKELLASLAERKATLVAQLRQLQRQLQALEAETQEHGRVNTVLAQTLMDKHRTAGARNPLLFKSVCDVATTKEQLERVLLELKTRLAVASQRLKDDALYFSFRAKCERYGLHLPPQAAAGAPPQSSDSLKKKSPAAATASSSSLMPSSSARPATRALVQAMADRTNTSTSALGHSSGLCITNSVALQPRPKTGGPRSSSAAVDSSRLKHY